MLKTMKAEWMSWEETVEVAVPEEAILTAVGNGQWGSVLEQVRALDREMERKAAELCLEYALQGASVEVFANLLDMLPRGEYAGRVMVRDRGKNLHVEIIGTLVMLAAAQGMAEKLACLLDRGWDVNGASLDAAHSIQQCCDQPEPFFLAFSSCYEKFTACSESQIRVMAREQEQGFRPMVMRNRFLGATPLAAAVFCGELACTRVLLEHGAWKEESPVVAQVLMCRDRGEAGDFLACREAVLHDGDAPRPMALWAVVRNAGEEQLEEELNRCIYSEAAIARAVREMGSHYRMVPYWGYWEEERKRDICRLRILERHYPQVVRRPELAALLLRWGMGQSLDEEDVQYLVRLCPEWLDLSVLREALVRMPVRKACRFLQRVCEGRTCVMDRDSVPPNTPVMLLQTLLKCVEFLPPASEKSISGLSYAILNSGNLHLIRKALQTGILPAEEPTELLLQCMEDHGCSTMARSLLLTTPRQSAGLWTDHRKVMPNGPMFRWMPPESREAGYEALLDEACPPALERELVMRGLYDYRGCPEYETEDGRWKMESPLILLCWAGRSRSVEHWVRSGPEDTLITPRDICPVGEGYTLRATPLCAAAFAGQTDVVETLLSLGAEVNEQYNGLPSEIILDDRRELLPITPLLAAIVQGHWEVVRILLARGAVCDLTQTCVRRLWSLFQTEDLHRAVQALLNGEVSQMTDTAALTA